MLNTIQIGDRLLVSRVVSAINRGDIVVYRYPKNPDTQYLKRVVGLPGETIEFRGAHVFINGVELEERRVRVEDSPDLGALHELASQGSGPYSVYYTQSLDGDSDSHATVVGAEYGIRAPYRIPDGAYFVLGDNRDNSEDSRMYGPIKREAVTGRLLANLSSFSR